MLDMLAAVFIDAAGTISPKIKEGTRRRMAEASRLGQHERNRHSAMAAHIDAVLDTTMIETDRAIQKLDPHYKRRLNYHRRHYGLPPVNE